MISYAQFTCSLTRPACTAQLSLPSPGARAGYALPGFEAAGSAGRAGRPYPAAPPGLPGCRAHHRRLEPAAAPAGSRCHRGQRDAARPAPCAAPPAANLRRPVAGGRARGGAAPPLAAARGGRTAIGARRGQCRPAPPRRGFITGIPMAEAGNLLRWDRCYWRYRTARESRLRWPQSRAAPRDDHAAGLAQRGGSPVPAGSAAGTSAAGSRPPSHGAPGK